MCQANVQVTCLLLVKGTVWRDSDHKSTCENEPEFTFPLGVLRQVSYHLGIHIIQHQHWFFGDQRKKLQRKGRDPTSRLGQEVEEVSAEGSSP